MLEKLFEMLGDVLSGTASLSAEATSCIALYQPELPAELQSDEE